MFSNFQLFSIAKNIRNLFRQDKMSLLISSRSLLIYSPVNCSKAYKWNKLAKLNSRNLIATTTTSSSQTSWLRHNSNGNSTTNGIDHNNKQSKLIYKGQLTKRIAFLKGFSIFSSIGLAVSYYHVMKLKGVTGPLVGLGIVFIPFFISPFIISWLFKRYTISLYYNRSDETYTICHYGLFLNRKTFTFTRDQVEISPVTSMLNTFKVGKKPFFLHEDDLIDLESVKLYKKMLGYDKIKLNE